MDSLDYDFTLGICVLFQISVANLGLSDHLASFFCIIKLLFSHVVMFSDFSCCVECYYYQYKSKIHVLIYCT